jgi:hypothetical protein
LRDAKQYWGLEDFMSVKEKPVYNSANLDVHFISSLPVKQRPACTAWTDKRLAQIVAAES